ncbi:hypothetical protein IGJ51_001549 [Enterococcus sp. DIV0802c]
MDQKAFIESIDSTINKLKKDIQSYNRIIGIGNIIKIVLSLCYSYFNSRGI